MLKHYLPVLLLFMSGTSLALDMDYYAYDGFEQVRNGFERIALIFGSTSYIGIIFVFIVLGIVFGAYAAAGRSLANVSSGNTQMSLSWIFMPLFGTVIFKALILTTGTMHVYDPVQNRYEPVADVPNLIIAVSGFMNKVERAAIEIVDNNPAEPLDEAYGGVGFSLLHNIMSDINYMDDHYLQMTIKKYYIDCSPIALANPANPFSLQELRSGSIDLQATLGNLALPTVTTTFYDGANKSGTIDTCENVWVNVITPAISLLATFEQPMYSACSKAGFNIGDAIGQQRCREILDTISPNMFNVAGDATHLLRTRTLSLLIHEAMIDENPDVGIAAIAAQSTMLGGLGTSIAAAEWLPTVKATVTVIVLGITPILILFLVTPLFAKSLSLMVGLFAFVGVWGVIDAILQVGALDQAYAAMHEMRRHNMAMDAMMVSPESAQKGMAIFAKARVLGLTLSSLIAGSLFGVSVYGLAQAGGRLEEPIEDKGGRGANQILTAEGYGSYVDSMSQGYATSVSQAGSGGFERASNASAFARSENAFSDVQTFNELSKETGGGIIDTAAFSSAGSAGARIGSATATARASEKLSNSSEPSAMMATSARTANMETSQRIGSAFGSEQALSQGDTPENADALFNSAYNSSRQLSQTTAQTDIYSDRVHQLQDFHHQKTGEELSIPQASSVLARFEQADLEGNIQAFSGNTDEAVRFREEETSMSIGQQDGYIAIASQLGVSPQTLKTSQGKFNAAVDTGDHEALAQMLLSEVVLGATGNRITSTADQTAASEVYQDRDFYNAYQENAVNNRLLGEASAQQVDLVAGLLGSNNREAASAIVNANTSFTARQEQLPSVDPSIDPLFTASSTGGARINAALTADGDIATITADSGSSTYHNDQSTIRTGTNVSSSGTLILDEENQELLSDFLQTKEGDQQALQALKRDAAGYLAGYVDSTVSVDQTKSADASLSVKSPSFFGASAQASTSILGQVSDSDRVDAELAVVDRAFEISATTARAETNLWAKQEQESSGRVVTLDEREEQYYDRYAENINTELSATALRYEALRDHHADLGSEILQKENKEDNQSDRLDSNEGVIVASGTLDRGAIASR